MIPFVRFVRFVDHFFRLSQATPSFINRQRLAR